MPTDDKKVRPEVFVMPADRRDIKVSEMKRLGNYLRAFPPGRNAKIVVSEGKSKRSEDQNALWWVWNQELEREHDSSYGSDYYHSMNKLEILLPLMCSTWERWREEGEFIRQALSTVSNYRDRLKLANRFIESSSLHVAEGVLYTEEIQKYWLERGVTLVVKASAKKYAKYPEAMS